MSKSGDPLEHVAPGQSFEYRAPSHNAFCDAARAHLMSMTGQKKHQSDRNPLMNNTSVMVVRNTAGSDLAFGNIVAVSGVQVDPDTNEDSFKFTPMLTVAKPDVVNHGTLKFGVLLEPLASDAYGLCAFTGMVVCKVKVIQSWHRYATVKTDTVGYLESAPTGSAIIEYTDGTEGGAADWGIVNLGCGDTSIHWGKATSNWHKAAGNACYVEVNPCEDKAGTTVDTGSTIKVWLPRNGSREDPNVINNAVIPFAYVDPEQTTPEAVGVGDYLDGTISESIKMLDSGATIPDGWESLTAADKKALVMNDNPPTSGYDYHGGGENNHSLHATHDTHLDHSISETLTHNTHSEPSVNVGSTSITEGDKYVATVGRDGAATISGWDGSHTDHELHLSLSHDAHSAHDEHTQTSNWPPYYKVLLIRRSDNSAV